MVKRIFLILNIFIITISSFSQNDTIKMLQGEWILSGVKYEPYSKLYSKSVNTITDVLVDTALILKISDDKIEIISIRFSKYDTISYNYEIIPDDIYQFKIELKPEKKKGIRRKYKHCHRLIPLNVEKISNSYLTIKAFNLNYNTPFFDYSRANHYFKKTLDSTEISELNFKGKWFICDTISDYKDLDTIVLQKDSCVTYDNNQTYITKFDFYMNLEGDNNFSFDKYCITCVFHDAYYIPYFWRINSLEEKLILYNREESIKYNYNLTDDKLILIRIKD